MILWISRIRLTMRLSDKVFHPSSSLGFGQLEPCHAPVSAQFHAKWDKMGKIASITPVRICNESMETTKY